MPLGLKKGLMGVQASFFALTYLSTGLEDFLSSKKSGRSRQLHWPRFLRSLIYEVG